jgi:hypothetical protein
MSVPIRSAKWRLMTPTFRRPNHEEPCSREGKRGGRYHLRFRWRQQEIRREQEATAAEGCAVGCDGWRPRLGRYSARCLTWLSCEIYFGDRPTMKHGIRNG